MSKIKMCKLKNGSVAPLPTVKTTMNNIESLNEVSSNMDNISALYELGKKAHNPKHKISDNKLLNILVELLLLQSNGEIYESTKDIVQSAISFAGEFPIVNDPIVEILGDDMKSTT